MIKKNVSLITIGLFSSTSLYAEQKSMDCNKPIHAEMPACVSYKTDKSIETNDKVINSKSDLDHSKMDHSTMNHEATNTVRPESATVIDHSKMDHSQMAHLKRSHTLTDSPEIPVSDGSMAANVPMPFPGAMHMEDDPTLSKLMIHSLEYQYLDNNNDAIVLDAEAWVGKDLHKLWLKTDVEIENGELEEAEFQALYSRAVDPFWDFQIGIRKDFEPVSREWGVIGFKGTAPYMIDVNASLNVTKNGQVGTRLNTDYEMMLSQKTILAHELEVNFYSKDDHEIEVGSGLSDLNYSLRLKYEFKREFAPYIGVNWSKSYGGTADFLKAEGEKTSDTKLQIGFEAWF